ncbi:MAG: alpha-glucosidase/alpha-galactosidase, partial [Lachnospiraceae bacterium]|nr:alpha-glucosidase/alpha-galactosidase [Lachnospiraceae bacterium]
EEKLSGTIRLYDIDKQAAENNAIIGNHISGRKEAVGKWKYVVKDSLKDALCGVDFVVISILPGTFDEMEADVHMPERLGIYQSVGDTAGPGGIIRALRTLPMFAEIADAVKKYSPDAWVINYTNPMSLCVKALYHAFPEIKAFGCCHEVFGTQDLLRRILKHEGYVDELVDRHDININVLGINHFTWFDYASYKGLNLFPIYKKYIDANFERGWEGGDSEHWANKCFVCKHRVKFDLFNRYGLIAAAGDRHLAEFMPGDEYLKNPETVENWDFALTSVKWRKEDLQERLARSKRLAAFEEEVELKPTGEEGILLIKALCGLERVISNVNIPNTAGQISNLPRQAIVETNAVFERDSIRPVSAGSLPDNLYNLVIPHVRNHERILKAAFTYNKDLVIEAFMNDPLSKGKGNREEISKLVCDMIDATKKYLPKEWDL